MSISRGGRRVLAACAAIAVLSSSVIAQRVEAAEPDSIGFDLPERTVTGSLEAAGDQSWLLYWDNARVRLDADGDQTSVSGWRVIDNHIVEDSQEEDGTTVYTFTELDTGEVVTGLIPQTGWNRGATPTGWLGTSWDNDELRGTWHFWGGGSSDLGAIGENWEGHLLGAFEEYVFWHVAGGDTIRINTATGEHAPLGFSGDGWPDLFFTEEGVSWTTSFYSDGGDGGWWTLAWDSSAVQHRTIPIDSTGREVYVGASTAEQVVTLVVEYGQPFSQAQSKIASVDGTVTDVDLVGASNDTRVSPSGVIYGQTYVGDRRFIARVNADGTLTPVVEVPTESAYVVQLELAADRLVGIDGRLRYMDGEGQQGWTRSFGESLGTETLLPGRASSVRASAGRFIAADGAMQFYDRDEAKTSIPYTVVGSNGLVQSRDLSGPYLSVAFSSHDPEEPRVDKVLDAHGGTYDASGPLFGSTVLTDQGVHDFTTGASLWNASRQFEENLAIWGPWVGYRSDDGHNFGYHVVNRLTGEQFDLQLTHPFVDQFELGDGVAVVRNNDFDLETNERHRAIDVFDLSQGLDGGQLAPSLTFDGGQIALDVNRIAWETMNGQVRVATLPFGGESAPYLLGVLGETEGLSVDKPWTPELDFTTPLQAGTILIANSEGDVVRTLVTENSRDGSLRELAWDTRDENGDPVPSGEYTWTAHVTDAAGQQAIATDLVSDVAGVLTVVQEVQEVQVVTPEAPVQDGNVVTIPVAEGVEYRNPAGEELPGGSEVTVPEAGLTVRAVAQTGYEIADGAAQEWQFEYSGPEEPELTVVTPVAPTQSGNLVTIPTVEGVAYQDGSGAALAAGSVIELTEAGLAVAAEPGDGYRFAEGAVSNWEFVHVPETEDPEATEVTPTAPVQDGNLVAIPSVEGVIYQTPTGEALENGSVVPVPETGLAVVAVAEEGYQIADGEVTRWDFTYVAPEPELELVVPDAPTRDANTLNIPEQAGVIYQDANGTALAGGSGVAVPESGLTVTASAAEGFRFPEEATTQWSFAYQGTPPEPEPTQSPSSSPTVTPTEKPSPKPTVRPTEKPTVTPSKKPSSPRPGLPDTGGSGLPHVALSLSAAAPLGWVQVQ